MKAVELYRSVPRYLAARTLASRVPAVAGVAPLRLTDKKPPAKPSSEWVRVKVLLSGICGSDLGTVSGHSSFYFSPLVSLPFTPGHEVLGELIEDTESPHDGPLAAGTRVVLDPTLPCATRGVALCSACAAGETTRCSHISLGHVSAGLQTGFCADTGGGWSGELVAHPSQLHRVPGNLADERAVLIEPLACAVRIAVRSGRDHAAEVAVVGAGAVGLFTLLALRAQGHTGRITVVAKHPRQRELACSFGADAVVSPDEIVRATRRSMQAIALKPERGSAYLLGGVDVAIECAGSSSGLDTALRITRAGGRVVLAGMPPGGVDLTPLWFRELQVEGAYAGGAPAFRQAITLAADERLERLPLSLHRLARWRAALDEAANAGALGLGKVGFDLREQRTLRSVGRELE